MPLLITLVLKCPSSKFFVKSILSTSFYIMPLPDFSISCVVSDLPDTITNNKTIFDLPLLKNFFSINIDVFRFDETQTPLSLFLKLRSAHKHSGTLHLLHYKHHTLFHVPNVANFRPNIMYAKTRTHLYNKVFTIFLYPL